MQHKWSFRFIATSALAASVGMAAVPEVARVEPPGWWAGHSHNPVRLMISGSHLAGARIEAPKDFQTGSSRVNDRGDFLFVDLNIPKNAAPGEIELRLIGGGATNRVPFQLLPAPARTNESRGITTDDVIYLLMPDRFANGDPTNDNPSVSPGICNRKQPRHYHGGDLQGVLNHLDYFRELGVTTLWLTPWYDNLNHLTGGEPMADYHGYSVMDFYAVEEHFGDLPLLQKLVSLAHTNGFKVIQDQVVNHVSYFHPWADSPPTPTWINGSKANHLKNPFETWTAVVSNPPPDKFRATLDGWFFDCMPDLNQYDPQVAAYLVQNSLWWIGMTGVDAVRQDALPHVPRAYWSRWTAALKRQHPQLTVLGEMWDADPKRVAFFQGGQARFDGVDSGVDTLFDFPLHYAIRDVFAKGGSMTRLTDTLAADTNYVRAGELVTFVGLHDQPRFLSEEGATVDGLKLAFTFLMTTRGTPLIYSGDEIAMRGKSDPDNRRDFPGGWASDERNAFTPEGRTPEQENVRAHVVKLLRLRKELAPLRQGRLVPLMVNREAHAFARQTPEECVIVVLNNATRPQPVEIPTGSLTGLTRVTDRLGALGTITATGNRLTLMMPPRSAAVLTADQGQIKR